jgi:anti-sigma factor ChrR (cupin superfamily)
MISEQQQEQASLYVAGALTPGEAEAFETELSENSELGELVKKLERTAGLLAQATPAAPLPGRLKEKVLKRVDQSQKKVGPETARPGIEAFAGFRFLEAAGKSDWKQLPVPGAYIKLLSLEKERGYAVLLGKIEAGVRYPAHVNAGPEDFYILSGDLVVGDRKLVAGDFHHADKGSQHEVNYSIEGCTLLAVLTTDDPLVAFAMA